MKEVEDVSIWLFIWQFVVLLLIIGLIYLAYLVVRIIIKANKKL
ncbi:MULTISPECIES: hypothetical protein [Flavobacterium]|nr:MULTISPECIES: hypothetical protein [Flavobacterium]